MDPANFVLRPFNREERQEVLTCEKYHLKLILDAYLRLFSYFQLDFTLQTGLEAVRILVQDNFDKSATFVNSAKSLGTTLY